MGWCDVNLRLRLFKVMASAWPSMLAGAILAALAVGANVGLMATAAFLIAQAAWHPPLSTLSLPIVGVRFCGLARATLRYGERYLQHDATFRLLARLRVWFFTALEPLAPARLAQWRSGDMYSRIVADVETLQFFYLRVVAPPLAAILVALGTGFFLAQFHGALTFILAAGFVAAGVICPAVLKSASRRCGEEVVAAQAELKVRAISGLHGLTELTAYSQLDGFQADIVAASRRLTAAQDGTARLTALAEGLGQLFMYAAVWLTLLAATVLTTRGLLDGVYVAAIVLAVESSFEAVLPLAGVAPYLAQSDAAGRRLFQIIDAVPAVTAPRRPVRAPDQFGVVWQDVYFTYQPDLPPALHGVSFAVPPGGRLALVGASGAGKSTVAALLLRFWDCQDGSIIFGGRNIKDYDPEELRRYISVVPQEVHLFNATVRDNILLARSDASQEDLRRVCHWAGLTDLLARLPAGWDTMVGSQGVALSGGERRRVAVARALLKNTPVLILDEPTAGLDAVSALQLTDTLLHVAAGRTLLLITHRLLGLDRMDEIVVLERGRVAEHGRQAQLLARHGVFFHYWRLQQDVWHELLN